MVWACFVVKEPQSVQGLGLEILGYHRIWAPSIHERTFCPNRV